MDVAQENISLQIIDASLEALLEESFDLPGRQPTTAFAHIDEATEPPQAERRFSRVPFRGRADAVIQPHPSAIGDVAYASEVLTTDISRGGLSLLHRRELIPGQRVVLELQYSSRAVEVCWCSRVWPGLYVAGCQFIDHVVTNERATFANVESDVSAQQ